MSVRLDRWATLYLVSPLRRFTANEKLAIPILMYHSIADEDESAVHPYYRTATSPAGFAAQMSVLRESGYSVIALGEAVATLSGGSTPISHRVVITFDDGFRNFYQYAFPALQQHGFTATMFLATAHIGASRQRFLGKECLTWNEVRELQRHGICFGSHTVTHPKLRELDAHSIKEEIVVSKHTIEQELGCAVKSFSYPYAFPETDDGFKRRLRDALRQAGYENGVCTTVGRPGPASDPFFLRRLPVNSDDDPQLFHAKLAGSYDWLARPQYLVKMAKKWAS